MLKPGATIGILGGGQLARMLALAAAPLGLRCHVYSPEKNSCAFEVVHAFTCADYEDEDALAGFADSVDVITYEFENIPAKTAAFLSKRKQVAPDPKVLELTQDRLIEKNLVSELGIATAPYAPVHSATQLADGLAKIGLPAVLKTRTLGYDGKGQAKIVSAADANAAWRSLRGVPCILEGFVAFEREVSVIAARGHDGKVECFEVTENEHRDHILHISHVPAKVSAPLATEAKRVATKIAKALDYVGVMGVELFVVRAKGKQHRPQGRDGQSDRRRGLGCRALADPARHVAAHLRQGQTQPAPQDGPRHAGVAGEIIGPRPPRDRSAVPDLIISLWLCIC